MTILGPVVELLRWTVVKDVKKLEESQEFVLIVAVKNQSRKIPKVELRAGSTGFSNLVERINMGWRKLALTWILIWNAATIKTSFNIDWRSLMIGVQQIRGKKLRRCMSTNDENWRVEDNDLTHE